MSYTYTPTSQIATTTDGRAITAFTYNERNWLTGRKDPDGAYTQNGYSIEYGYDVAGNRTAVELPAGTTRYSFNERNWLEAVTDPNSGVTRYTYNAIGKLIKTQFASGVTETRRYNDINQLKYLETSKLDANTGAKVVLTSYTYTLDNVGNRLAVTDHTGRTVAYEYDDLYRLEQEQVRLGGTVAQTIDFRYDNVGNRLSQTDSATGTTTYRYDDNDRLTTESIAQIDGSTRTTIYSYDDNGNTLSKTTGTQQTSYTWNDENRLVAVQTADGKSLSYVYNSEGIRVSATVDGTNTNFLVDHNRDYAQVLEERVNGNLAVFYVYGNDLISQERGSQTSFYLVDGLGSTTALTDAQGNLTDTYTYSAFGEDQ